jgi:hypothetical protein
LAQNLAKAHRITLTFASKTYLFKFCLVAHF